MYDILLTELLTISLFKKILSDSAVKNLVLLLQLMRKSDSDLEDMIKAYCSVYSKLIDSMQHPDFYEHVSNLLLYDENPFTLACERKELCEKEFLKEQTEREYSILERLAVVPCSYLKNKLKEKSSANDTDGAKLTQIIDNLPEWNPGALEKHDKNLNMMIPERINAYEKNGSGIFLKHSFFVWNGELKQITPVENPDLITLDRLYLVDSQKEMVIKNTDTFLNGLPANNILLYGDRGTGSRGRTLTRT